MPNPAQPNARSAHASIKGYEYQFDRTILELLKASATAIVHIEGIEDVDVFDVNRSEVTQIKYYEAKQYTSSKTLRKPIELMLQHFDPVANLEYVLHVHFGEPRNLPEQLDLEDLKHCLTKYDTKSRSSEQLFADRTDSHLQAFCDRLRIRQGPTFDSQQDELVSQLKDALECTTDEVQAIYKAKARDFVHERARTASTEARKATRAQFIQSLKIRELLYSAWQLEEVGREKYIKTQSAHLKREGFANPKVPRAILLEIDESTYQSVLELTEILSQANDGRLKGTKPWTVVVDGTDERILRLKRALIDAGIYFNDGYETVHFSSEAFNRAPVVNLIGSSDKIKTSSYAVRLVTADNFVSFVESHGAVRRMITIGKRPSWQDSASELSVSLTSYERGILHTLIGAIA
ncbi:hypothetical protein [Clavibacter michiganensis]|uniref:hypothetical protein n=1 Tax=Clavibacter michiganensis TaxID=28447 RepID=UPI000B6B1FE5|nr:hypothetical protein [Clavibacter michiganensis]MDO4028229.1 hypothetical protein [Clavibacter michiganensis]OUD89068.1 hypothetical protein CMMCAS05_14665 [Clavibacter michiganensis subsp. michiganensis]OUE03268.1 hypothetical protein CMMCAS08_11110 [Clavibacter michiganensis subsp. michiganensis]OUE13934.1 hypothetical protein CMMCAY01_13110 [Clavibacter michiganensis subsp. michiganensis]